MTSLGNIKIVFISYSASKCHQYSFRICSTNGLRFILFFISYHCFTCIKQKNKYTQKTLLPYMRLNRLKVLFPVSAKNSNHIFPHFYATFFFLFKHNSLFSKIKTVYLCAEAEKTADHKRSFICLFIIFLIKTVIGKIRT